MKNQFSLSPESSSPQNPKPKLAILIAAGLTILAVGIVFGLAVGKYSPKAQISSYDDCVKAKGSRIKESYPATCVTTAGQRFIQPVSAPTAIPTKTADSTANWKTYTDFDRKFKFQYSNKLIPKDQKIQPDANEYTQLFRVFTTFMEDSTPEFVVRVRNGFNSQQMEKEDFDDMEGHVDYKIIKREEINLSGKKAVKISIFVGPPEDFRETSGVIYIYSDIDLQESLSIRQLGMDTDQFNQILSTFKFLDPDKIPCGGIMGTECPSDSTCRLDGSYPDASGVCVKN